jgi:predicted nucleic acid-binding protein
MAVNSLIIVDSSGLISLAIKSDSNHRIAVSIANNFVGAQTRALIPAEVFAETLNILGKKFGHDPAAQASDAIRESAAFIVTPTSDTVRLDAVELFRSVPASVSYTDCLVMVTASHHKTRDIFGFDEIFTKRGYQLPATDVTSEEQAA